MLEEEPEPEPQLIGKGSYGCVFKPPLQCQEPSEYLKTIHPGYYDDKVSKAMINKDANAEINSQQLLDELDPRFTYHLPTPVKCKIKPKDKEKCVITKEGEQFYSDTLLILQDGGLSLKDFIEKIIENISILVETKREMVYNFWSQSIKLVEFLQLLHTNGVFHNDLKPENILFNTTTYDLKVIDFGLMDTTVFYNNDWYFAHPPESKFIGMKSKNYDILSTCSDTEFYSLFFTNNDEYFNNFHSMYEDFIKYVTNPKSQDVKQTWFQTKYQKNFFRDKTQEEVYECYENTLDIYGLGVSLQYVFERTHNYFKFNTDDAKRKSYLRSLLFLMTYPNCFERIQIDDLYTEYLKIINWLIQPQPVLQQPPLQSRPSSERRPTSKRQSPLQPQPSSERRPTSKRQSPLQLYSPSEQQSPLQPHPPSDTVEIIKLIGKGGFGCVYKPALKCKDDKPANFYDDKLSKAMTKKHAEKELRAQKIIDEIDSEYKYHLKKADMCTMRDTVPDNCILPTRNIGDDQIDTLLLFKDGGLDLVNFIKKIIENISILDETKREMVYNFWSQSIKLVEFLQLLHTNGVFHNDLKPQNILFDTNIPKLNVIDFGYTDYKVKTSGIWHFSHPPEVVFMLKTNEKYSVPIEKYNIISGYNKDRFYSFFFNNPKFIQHYNYFIREYVTSSDTESKSDIDSWFKEQFEKKNFFTDKPREEVYECYKNTLDIYGLGVSLIYVFERTRKYFEFTEDDKYKRELHILLLDMIHPNCFERIQIDELNIMYSEIIHKLKQPQPVLQQPPLQSRPSSTLSRATYRETDSINVNIINSVSITIHDKTYKIYNINCTKGSFNQNCTITSIADIYSINNGLSDILHSIILKIRESYDSKHLKYINEKVSIEEVSIEEVSIEEVTMDTFRNNFIYVRDVLSKTIQGITEVIKVIIKDPIKDTIPKYLTSNYDVVFNTLIKNDIKRIIVLVININETIYYVAIETLIQSKIYLFVGQSWNELGVIIKSFYFSNKVTYYNDRTVISIGGSKKRKPSIKCLKTKKANSKIPKKRKPSVNGSKFKNKTKNRTHKKH